MPGSTPVLHLPYPLASEPPDGPVQIKALADAIDAGATFIVGEVRFIAVIATPAGWVPADGAALSRTGYAKLFAAIGTVYGIGDGSTTFGVPDLRGRTPVGAGAGAGLTARAGGAKLGEEAHTLLTVEAAQKAVATGTQSANHVHPMGARGMINPVAGSYAVIAPDFGPAVAGGTESATHVHSIAGSDATTPHNNMQPSTVIPAYIYAGT